MPRHYFTLYKDTFDRKHILQFGSTISQIFGDARSSGAILRRRHRLDPRL